MLFTKEKYIDK